MKRKKLYWAVLSAVLALALCVSGTFAWLSKEQKTSDAYTALSDFEVEGTLSFGGTAYTGSTILVPVSFSSTDANYIGKMKYTVRYSGVSPAYIRVRILEQWLDVSNNEIMPASYLDYAVSTDVKPENPADSSTVPAAGSGKDALADDTGVWVDHRSADYCYYYSVPVQPKLLTTPSDGGAVQLGDGTVVLTLFDQKGMDLTGIEPGNTQLSLLLEVEAVQPNRFREFWHIDVIPSP